MKKKGEPFDAAGQAATFKDKIQNSADRKSCCITGKVKFICVAEKWRFGPESST